MPSHNLVCVERISRIAETIKDGALPAPLFFTARAVWQWLRQLSPCGGAPVSSVDVAVSQKPRHGKNITTTGNYAEQGGVGRSRAHIYSKCCKIFFCELTSREATTANMHHALL